MVDFYNFLKFNSQSNFVVVISEMSKIGWKYKKYVYIAVSVAIIFLVNRSLQLEIAKTNGIPNDFIQPQRISINSITRTTTRSGLTLSKKNVPTHKVEIKNPPEPTLSSVVLSLHERLNLTDPGHLGAPVVLPKTLDNDIQKMVDEGYSKYKINEFISSLIPLNRELPDIRYATKICSLIEKNDCAFFNLYL